MTSELTIFSTTSSVTIGDDTESSITIASTEAPIQVTSEAQESIEIDFGAAGAAGANAYQVAVANGFVGSIGQWLASLNGQDGEDGLSAYQIAIANGFVGSEAAWLESLKGASGTSIHGELSGLENDDHPQYLNTTRGDARYSQLGHTHSKGEVGLGNVDNTSDANKPVSNAQAAANAAVQAAAIQRANHTGTQLALTISDFAATVRETVLTGFSLASALTVTATDSVLVALGKLQAQITGLTNTVAGVILALDDRALKNLSNLTNPTSVPVDIIPKNDNDISIGMFGKIVRGLWVNAIVYPDTQTPFISAPDSTLIDKAEVVSLAVDARIARDPNDVESLNWDKRQLKNAIGDLAIDFSGDYATAVTPPASDNSTNIATTEWVQGEIATAGGGNFDGGSPSTWSVGDQITFDGGSPADW